MLKHLMRAKLGEVPEVEREKLLELVEKNPELFKVIAMDAHKHMQAGKDQMSAVMEAVREHEEELRKLTS